MNILHEKSVNLTSCMSVVVFGDFCRFKPVSLSQLFLYRYKSTIFHSPNYSSCVQILNGSSRNTKSNNA